MRSGRRSQTVDVDVVRLITLAIVTGYRVAGRDCSRPAL